MNKAEKQKIIGELKDFYKELKSYKRLLDPERELSENQKRYRESLREKLVRKIGKLKEPIIQLTGKQFYIQFGSTREFWAEGLSSSGYLPAVLTSLGFCIDATNEAIGKLETAPKPELESQGVSMKEPPEALVVDNRGKSPFEEAWEVEIQVDSLATLDSIIASVASELYFKNCYFEVRSADSQRTNSSARFDVFIIGPATSKTPIGTFTLHWLGSNRAMLRVPPRSRWGDSLTGGEKIRMGLSGSQYDEYFSQFIESLEDRFTHYGLKATPLKRLWQWLKSHKIFSIFITAIMFIAAIITIWGFVSGTFG
jgi:hypothetical protein